MSRLCFPGTKRIAPTLLCGLLSSVFATLLHAQDLSKRVDELFVQWDRVDSPGCAVAVYQGGKMVHSNGYGMADLEHDVPITPSTVFNIASMSKQFTAARIALLAEDGKELGLDDEVRKFIPEFPYYTARYGRDLTIRHLIHHTSGIRDFLEMWSLAGKDSMDYVGDAEVLAMICRQKELNFPPGEQYMYSNSGYFLLGVIVEMVSGKNLREYAKQHIFDPLGMSDTHFLDDHHHLIKNRALGYQRSRRGDVENLISRSDMVGPGGLYTTIEDLSRWDRNFYDNQLGKGGRALIETMHTRGKLRSGRESPYAFALRHGEYRGLPTIQHGGSFAGYQTDLLRFPDQRLSVVILSNLRSFDPTSMTRKVAEIFLAEHFSETWVEEAPAESNQPAIGVERAIAEVDPAIFERYMGEYQFRRVSVTITVDKDRLMMQTSATQPKRRLYPSSETEYFAEVGDGWLTFSRSDTKGKNAVYDQLTLRQSNGQTIVFRRADAPDFGPLADFAGQYVSEELGVTYRITVEGTWLSVDVGSKQLQFYPVHGADLFTCGRDRSQTVTFQRDAERAVTGFELDGSRVKNLKFQRR